MSKYGMGKGGMCKGAMCKMNCMDEGCGSGLKKGDMDEKDKYCQKQFGKDYPNVHQVKKAQCDKHCGDVKKGNYMMNEELENPKLADRDKDGKLSSWEKTVGKKIEQSKKGKETGDYKSDRGNKKIPFKEETKKPVKKEDFTAEFIRKNTDKMQPMDDYDSRSRRMGQGEAMGGGKNDRMGEPYTVDPRAFDMASRRHYANTQDKDQYGNKIPDTGEAVPGHIEQINGFGEKRNNTNTTTRTDHARFPYRRRWLKRYATETRLDGR